MKHKLIILLVAFGTCFNSWTTIIAQPQYEYELDEDSPYITDASQLSSPWTDPGEGNLENMLDNNAVTFWHSSWHGEPPHNVQGSHFFQVEMPDDYYDDGMVIAFKYVRRIYDDNDHTTKWTVYGTNKEVDFSNDSIKKAIWNDPIADKEKLSLLAEIETPFTDRNQICISTPFDPQGFKFLRFYSEEQAGVSYGSRVYFHVGDFNLYVPHKRSDAEIARLKLEETIDKYTMFSDYENFPIGDKPGCYSRELVDAFMNKYWESCDAQENSDDADEMNRLREELSIAYDTIWTSRMPLILQSGYYRFRTAGKYYQMVTDPETGVEEKIYSLKYMRAALNAKTGKIEGCWGSLDDMMVDASSLWKVTRQEDGRYDIINAGYDLRIDTVSRSTIVTLSEAAVATWRVNAVYTNDDDETYVNLRIMDDDTYDYLHQEGHNGMYGESNATDGRLIGWTSTFNLSNSIAGASEFIPEFVPESDALEIIKNFGPYKEREAMLASYYSIMTAAKKNLQIAIDPIQINLISDASQLSSPFSQNDLGSADGGNLSDGVLIDNDLDTYWHSVWSGQNVPKGNHYLQVELPEGFDPAQEIYMTYTRRNTDNNQMKYWLLRGTNDPDEVDEENCDSIFSFETPWNASNYREFYKSGTFNTKGFKYIRFYCINGQSTTSGSACFHAAEIHLSYDKPNPNAPALSMGDVVPNLQKVIEAQEGIDYVTVEMYNELKEAYDAFMDKFVNTSIDFADANVKSICVRNWDKNHNGELSYEEAAEITNLKRNFTNISIKSFDELRHFTGLNTLNESVFYACNGLTSISIPENVLNIGRHAFNGCSSLSTIRVGMKNPIAITSDVFDSSTYEKATLYVPKGSKAAYETADVWKDFKDIVEYVDNYIVVDNQTIIAGESVMVKIKLENMRTDLVAFQMDLTLPKGLSLDKDGCPLSSRITDEKQELTIGKLGENTYRLTSTSFDLKPIIGKDGTLLTLKLTATEDCDDGQATISNILFSTSGSRRVDMPDETFDIDILHKFKLTYKLEDEVYKTSDVIETTPLTLEAEPTKDGYTFGGWSELPVTMPGKDVEITGRFYLYGDVNTDEEVDVVDVVDIARFVVATPSGKFREKLADLNKDNSVNLGDAVVLVNHIAGDVNFVKAMAAPNEMIEHGDALSLTKTGKTLALNLTNRRAYTAFQFDLYVDDEANVTRMALNAQRKQEHQLFYNKVENGHYRVAVLSTSNRTFNGNEGELLSFIMDAEPSADTEIRNIRFFDTKGNAYAFDAIGIGLETGLKVMQDAASKAQGVIYDLQGRKLTKVQRGVNIVNGKTLIIKK